ncbi:hypothetical protein [Methanothrix soehngenii]|uniref:hypothetical protein n=1 Tax=Methanothrix soehngenii TaxID=2223 RepID=UPI00300CC9B5
MARASLDELLLDYEDFLRQRRKRLWGKDDREAPVRAVGWQQKKAASFDPSDPAAHWKAYAAWLDHEDSAIVANTTICLIHQANYLLDQQIAALERLVHHRGRLQRTTGRGKACGTGEAAGDCPGGE